MAGKRVLLTLEPKIYGFLSKEAEDNLMSVQELISDLLRKHILAALPHRKSKAGRPPKLDEPLIAAFARKR